MQSSHCTSNVLMSSSQSLVTTLFLGKMVWFHVPNSHSWLHDHLNSVWEVVSKGLSTSSGTEYVWTHRKVGAHDPTVIHGSMSIHTSLLSKEMYRNTILLNSLIQNIYDQILDHIFLFCFVALMIFTSQMHCVIHINLLLWRGDTQWPPLETRLNIVTVKLVWQNCTTYFHERTDQQE